MTETNHHHHNPATPTLTPSGFLLLVRADPRSPIPDPRARIRPLNHGQSGYSAGKPHRRRCARAGTASGVFVACRNARKRGFPARGAVFACGVVYWYSRRPDRGTTARYWVPENHSHPRPPGAPAPARSPPIGPGYRLPGPPSLSPIPAALLPVNPAEKPLSCSFPAPLLPGIPWLSFGVLLQPHAEPHGCPLRFPVVKGHYPLYSLLPIGAGLCAVLP